MVNVVHAVTTMAREWFQPEAETLQVIIQTTEAEATTITRTELQPVPHKNTIHPSGAEQELTVMGK